MASHKWEGSRKMAVVGMEKLIPCFLLPGVKIRIIKGTKGDENAELFLF